MAQAGQAWGRSSLGSMINRVGAGTLLLLGASLGTATMAAQMPAPGDLVNTMLGREHQAAQHKVLYSFLSNERSERTLGHMWTERVVETPQGKVRLLLSEDGQTLSPERAVVERNRLANEAAHPDQFAASQQTQKDDDAHAQGMLDLIPKGFILENMRAQGVDWRIDFRPNPDFSPDNSEQKVLHGMSGWLLVDQKAVRLHHIEGVLPQDLSLFGFLASVKAGSRFETTKLNVEGNWRTARVVTDIRGKAALFKSIGKNAEVTRSEFHPIPQNLTVAQAVAMAEK